MQLSELRTRLRVRIGNPSTTDVPDTPNLDRHINDALQEISNKYKFKRRRARAKFVTAANSDKYDVAGLTDVIFKVWDRTNGKLLENIGITKIAQQDFDATPNALVKPGKPDKWTHIETYIQLFPPPDGIYTIEFVYKVRFASLANAGDSPNIPPPWHRGIPILAAALYYDDEAGDPTKATYHQNAFKNWVADMPVEEHEATEAIDSGVELPSLGASERMRFPDGVWWDSIP